MKKRSILGLMLVVILVAGLFAGCSSNTTKTEDNANNDDKTFVVGLDDSFPPMGFRDDKNEIVGFDVEMSITMVTIIYIM